MVEKISKGEVMDTQIQQDGDCKENIKQGKGGDAETTATSLNLTDSAAHKSLNIPRTSDYSYGGHTTGDDDCTSTGLEKQSLASNIKMHVINEDYRSSTSDKVRYQHKTQTTVAIPKSPTTIKQIQQQVDAQIQQQKKTHENRHRQNAAGIQHQQIKQLPQQFQSQPPVLPTKQQKNGSQESQIQMKQSGPTLSVQSQQQTTVKIKQKKGRFSVLENCSCDDKTCQQMGANIAHPSGSIPNQQRPSKSVFDNCIKPFRSSPGKHSRSKSLEISANGTNANSASTTVQQTIPSSTKTAYTVQYSSSAHISGDPNLASVGTEKKGRFIISNSVDAGKVQQTGKLSTKSVARSQPVGDNNNQQRCDPVVGRKKKGQQLLDVPQLSLQGHMTNDYGSSNAGGVEPSISSGHVINMKVTSPKKLSSDNVPPLSMDKPTSGKTGTGTSTVPTIAAVSHASTGGLMKGGMGKMFHFLEQMKLEVVNAEKIIKSLQSDNKFLRGKNKELEAKCNEVDRMHAEEKVARESAELKIKTLKKRLNSVEGCHAVNIEQQIALESIETEPVLTNNCTVNCHGSDNEISIAKRPDGTQDKPTDTYVRQNENLNEYRFRRRKSQERKCSDKGTIASCQFQTVETIPSSPPTSRGSPNSSGFSSSHPSEKIEVGHVGYGTLLRDPKTEVTNASLELLKSTTKPDTPLKSQSRINASSEPSTVQSNRSVVTDSQAIVGNLTQREPLSRANSLASFDPLGKSGKLLGKEEGKIAESKQSERFDESCFHDDQPKNKTIFHSISRTPELATNESMHPGEKFDPYKVN